MRTRFNSEVAVPHRFPKLSAVLAVLAIPVGVALWAQTPPDTDPPVIQILESGSALVDGRLFNRAASPVIQVTDASAVTVDATLDGAAFTAGSAVAGEGTHLLSVSATDAAGNTASLVVGFGIDTAPPVFGSIQPADQAVVAAAQATLQGQVTGAVSVTVDGQAATLVGEDFTAGPYTLAEGLKTWTIVATDAAGNTAQRTHRITRDSQAPTVAISQPTAGIVLKDASVDVVGSASDPRLTGVTVNGIATTRTGTSWVAKQVPLAEGSNTLTARAEDQAGNAAEAARTVVRDSQAPALAVTDPAPGTVVPGASITLRGTAGDPHLDRVEIGGVRAQLANGSWSLLVGLKEGVNSFTVKAFDKVSNVAEATVSVTRDSEAPAVRITQPADGARLKTQTVTVTGTVEQEAGITVTVNGVAATVADGAFTAEGVALVEGQNTLIARVKDSLGNQGTHTRIVTRDTVAPKLESADPASGALALPVGSVFRLTFSEEIADPAAGSWRLETGAGQAIAATAQRYGDVLIMRPSVPLPSSSQVRLALTAALTDLAGNALAPQTLTFLTVDTTAPAAPVFSPAPAGTVCAPSLTLTGTAEAGAVVRVEGGAAAAETRAGEVGAFSVAVQLTPGGLNRLRATATDSGGNVSPAAVAEVIQDCGAPRVVSAERQGDLFRIVFSEKVRASSLSGAVTLAGPSGPVAGAVSLAADGVTATFDPDGALPAGALRLEVSTAVLDTAGNAMAFPWSQVFGAQGGSGFLLGTVIDNATGRPLAGARVLVWATNGTTLPEPRPEQVTGADGRFRLPVPAGTHDLTIARPGYTPSFRIVTTGAGQGTDVFDPRLTPAAKATVGALGGTTSAAVTPLDEQGLPFLLPYGWSPRGAVWLDMDGAALPAESTLSLPVDAPNGTSLTLVHLDLASLQWRVAGADQVTGGRVEIALPAGTTDGAWAAVQADAGALAPPAPVNGAALSASARPAGDEATGATLTFNPEVVLPSQSSLATAVYTLSEDAASGLPLTLLIEEELTLLDNSVRRQTPYQADVILYHAPDGTPRSRFRLSPSEAAQELPLKLGAEDVTLRTYGGEAVAGNVVGPEGGTVTGDQGDRIDLPAGAVTGPTAIVLTRKTAADLGVALPSGVELAGVVDVDLGGGRLLAPAALSLALSPAPAAGEKGLLLHVIELESGRTFRAVAALQATANGWTTAAIDPLDLAWPGVRDEGLYAFVRLTAPFGYLRGTVSDVGGADLSGAIVRSPSAGWVQISNADGSYVLPAPVAAVVVATAENRLTGNLGTGAAEIAAADARVDLDLALQPVGPRVVQTTPADEAVDVPQGIEPTVRFSEPVDPASVEGAIQLLSEGQPVTVDLEVQGTLVRVKPRSTLLPATAHELRITSGVKDLQGISLEAPVAVQFTTLRVLLTDDIDLTRVFLVAPDANGEARVLGRPGAVPAGALVFVENRTALVDTPSVAAGQDGGFDLDIEAALSHTLILHVLIPNSNEIVARLTPFRTPDLKGAYVDDKAFTFTTGDGVKVVVPEGAFSGPTIVKLSPKPLTESPRPVPSGFEAVYNFELDFGGAEARKALQITLPALASTPEAVNGYYLLNRMIELLGKRYWMMHDLMRLDADTGRLTTELPPEDSAGLAAEPAAVVASLADPFALAQAGGGKSHGPTSPLVRQYKHYVVGSAFPGQYQVAAPYIDLGFTVFPSFDMNMLVGIWNMGMEGMATALNAKIATFLEGDGILMPTRRNETQTIVVRNLTTGFRLYQNDFTQPPGDALIFLPPDVYGDKVPPLPSSGDPIRFFLLDFSGSPKQEIGIRIKAELADGMITIKGEKNTAQSKVEIRFVGLDDDTNATVTSGDDGSFTLEVPGQIKKRYLLVISARIPTDQPLQITFNEALFEGFPGVDVLDANGRTLDAEKTPVLTSATVKIALKTGWRAGQRYTLRLSDDLADASGNQWKKNLDVKFQITGSEQIGTVNFQAVRDIAHLGSWLFVAADSQGFFVMDASDPANVKNVLPNNLGFPFPLADPVRGLSVDPHGRVLVTGGGVTGFGQLKIFDPLALDIPAITAAPDDPAVRFAAFKGSTIISDKLGGTGTQLPSGTPRRVAVLSNDLKDEWKLGDPYPPNLQVTTSLLPEVNGVPAEDFQVNVTGTDGKPNMPVTLQNLTRGRWHRIDADAQGHYTISVKVQDGDRLQLLRNQDSIAYVATAGVGLEVVDVNAFYKEEHNHIESDIRGTYSGFREHLTLCGQPVADIGTAFQDLDTLFDPENLNPIVVVGMVSQRGFILLRSNPESVGQISLLNEECTEIEGSTAISGLTVLQGYIFDLNKDGELDEELEKKDYILVAHQKGGILIYDVTNRENIDLVGRIKMPGLVNQLSVNRETRRLLVSGGAAGFYILDLDIPPTLEFLDDDGDGKDDRILESVTLTGNTNANVRLVPELGLAFAGGLNRGLTTVAVGYPRIQAIARDNEGRYREIKQLAPFGVPTTEETSDPESPTIPGYFRILASLPGVVGEAPKFFTFGALKPAQVKKAQCLNEELKPDREIPMRRMADNPWEPGYQLYISKDIAVLADPRASRRYDRSTEENQNCTRCDLGAEGVEEGAHEILSGPFVNVWFSVDARTNLDEVYSKDRMDAAELRIPSVPWANVPSPKQEPKQNPGLVSEAPGLLPHSGEMTSSAIDISIRGRGIDFEFQRFYRSQTIGHGPFGPGWDHNFNKSVRELPNGDVEYYDGLGRRETWQKQQDGTLKAPQGRFASLERVESGWVLLDARHMMTRFDAEGRLTSIADAVKDSKDTGNELTFHYDASSRLVRIHDTTDRDILIEWEEEDEQGCSQIKKITDFSDREFLYDYDDNNRLVSVKTPPVQTVLSIGEELATQTEPLETRYTYDSATGSLASALNQRDNLTSISDPKGQSWLNVSYNDASGSGRKNEVTSQTWGGGNIQVQYNFGARKATITDPRNKEFSYTFTDKGQVAEVQDPENGLVQHTYDQEGLVSSRTDAYGRVTTYAYDHPCGGSPIGERRSRGNLTRVTVTPDTRGPNGSSPTLVTCTEYEGYSNQPVQVIDPRGTVTLISRNEVGLPLAVTQAAGTPDASTVQTSYNERGQPTQTINPKGNIVQYLYNSFGYPAGMMVDPNGLSLFTRLETDQRGNVIAMIDPRGVGFTRAYNTLDWVVETRRAVTGSADGAPPLSYATSYFHDPNGNVVEEHLPFDDGSTVTRRSYVYDELDKLLSSYAQPAPGVPFAEWASTARFYDLNRNLIRTVGPNGQTTDYGYDDRNFLVSVTRGVGTVEPITETFAHDLEGQRTTYTDARQNSWTTAYDGYGRASRTTDPLGNYATVSYDDNGNPLVTGAYQVPENVGGEAVLLAQKTAQYDWLNRPRATTEKLWRYGASPTPRDLTARFEYDAASNLIKAFDELNRQATWEYDKAERLVAMVDPAGNRIEVDLDKAGNAITTRSIEIQPSGGPITVTSTAAYDALGRQTKAIDGLQNTTTFTYDARNNVRFAIDPESFVTESVYDGLDRLTKQSRPEGITVTYGYDKSSRLVSYKDALSQETTYSYDALDRLTGVRYADQTQETYGYDLSYNLRQITDANGNVITQTFDPANRLTGRTASLGVGVIGPGNESYAYDGLSRMTRAQSGSTVTEIAFDSLSRSVRERNAGREIAYEYDDVGNPTRLEYPSAFAVRQSYDALNRPTSIGPVNGTSFVEAVGYTWRGPDLIASKTLGNGLTASHAYDAAKRLLDVTFLTANGQKVFQESLSWTPRNLKAAQSRGDLNGRGQIFAYDGAGRLVQGGKSADPLSLVTNNTVVQPTVFESLPDAVSYVYDKAHNLLARNERENGVAESLTLPLDNSGRNRPASIGSVILEWDANGNLKRKGDLRFEYDFRNRLTRVTRDNVEVAVYRYDAFNRRVEKTLGGESRETFWHGWQPVEEYRNGDLEQSRIYGDDLDEIVQLQVDVNGDGTAEQVYSPLYDETGNLVVMTGDGGKPVERYEYTPYGQRKIFVDNTPPSVEQVRVKDNTLWIELSEDVSGEALAKAVADQTLTLVNLTNQQSIPIAVAQPVTSGRQARRRLVITTTSGSLAPETQVRLTLPGAALLDSFLNQPAQGYEVTFAWPQSDSVIQDGKSIHVERVALRGGALEIELSEEANLATTGAILINGAAGSWSLGQDRYSLKGSGVLEPGVYTLTIGTALTDLSGSALVEAFSSTFTVVREEDQVLFEAPDPRETPVSTIGNVFGFKGLPLDEETGLIYFRNRYYDPEIGRFVTVDPKGYEAGPNLYQFGMNDPLNMNDPMGLSPWSSYIRRKAAGKLAAHKLGEKAVWRAVQQEVKEWAIKKGLKDGLFQVHHLIGREAEKRFGNWFLELGFRIDTKKNLMVLPTEAGRKLGGLFKETKALHGGSHIKEYRELVESELSNIYKLHKTKAINEKEALERLSKFQAHLRKGLADGTIVLQKADRDKLAKEGIVILGVAGVVMVTPEKAMAIAEEAQLAKDPLMKGLKSMTAEHHAKEGFAGFIATTIDIFNPVSEGIFIAEMVEFVATPPVQEPTYTPVTNYTPAEAAPDASAPAQATPGADPQVCPVEPPAK